MPPLNAIKEFIVRFLLFCIATSMKMHMYPLAKFWGYRRFEPKPESVMVSCCTNGLGHIHQMERVLGVLQEEGIKFPVIALAREQKVPAYKLAALKEKFPGDASAGDAHCTAHIPLTCTAV